MGVAALDKHLKNMDSRIAIGDLAFTLTEKRADLQYRRATIVSYTNALRQSLKAVEKTIEAPQRPKKAVLAFLVRVHKSLDVNEASTNPALDKTLHRSQQPCTDGA